MSKNTGYKNSPLGLIPDDWEVNTISNLSFITKLAGFEYTNYFDYEQTGEIIALRVLNIRNGKLDLSDIQTIPKTVSSQLPRSSLRKNDLVISYVGTIGEVAIIKKNNVFHLAPNVAKITPNTQIISPVFLLYQLLSDHAHKRLFDLSTLTSQPALSMSRLRQLLIVSPPLSEQNKIAKILDTLDDVIAKTEAAIAKLKNIKTGLVHDLLTRGLDENGELRDPIKHPEQFKKSALGLIPKDWFVNKLDNICLNVVDCPHTTPDFLTQGILVARTSNIKDGIFDERSASFVNNKEYCERVLRLEPKAKDIIFTREAPVGEAFVIPENMKICLGQRTMLIRPNTKNITSDYLLAYIYSSSVQSRIVQLTGGTTNPHLNVGEVREFFIAYPLSINEQEQINLILNSHAQKIKIENQYLEKLKLQKKGLMQDLLTGKKRVNHLL